jgi:hypothetical protein
MEKPYLQDDLMKPSTKNLILAIGLGAAGRGQVEYVAVTPLSLSVKSGQP